ncbi:hypothetical protein WA026_001967 [Henosepilachna vigintioctopunctata]|uniref:Stabilizer of axonemal microtubules 1 n=1 Tax=Henosepilachna vigintioctopunctata TaxID=420089 RepID=A0AAW1UTF3_9CUCU
MACAPCGDAPPCIPVVADTMPKRVVNPCQPHECNAPDCCNVCVPLVKPCIMAPIPQRRMCKYIQPPRPKSYAPERTYLPPTAKMEENTIYRKSYIPSEGCRPCAVLPENNLCVGEGKISDNTVHKMSYMPHCQKPPTPIIPCSHKLLGEGPMQDLTTQKHDYVPKPFSKPCKIIPPISLFGSDCPLSDKTVNRLSYMPVDPCQVKVSPIYPIDGLDKPCGRMSDKTVHNMSFQPWEPQAPMPMPWTLKAPYRPPVQRMEDNTIHRMSYVPPGQYVECAPDDPSCVECPDPCNEQDPNHFRKDPNCRAACCCPRAAC